MTYYLVISKVDESGKCWIRRSTDAKIAYCKLSWLKPVTDPNGKTIFLPAGRVKAMRLEWWLDWSIDTLFSEPIDL